jgi:GcrA cell cycle regulator
MTVLSWSDDRVELLKKLWQSGLSASQIAAELGFVTRNAVIGKVHRLGLSGRGKPVKIGGGEPRRTGRHRAARIVYEARRTTKVAAALAELPDHPPPVTEALDNIVPFSQRLHLMELNDATCHWPVGDPSSREFFFCGGRALTSLPYCAHHSRIAYQPAADRRRQRPRQ